MAGKNWDLSRSQTDFISVIGEELGLIATMGVVVAFVLFVICGAFIALRSSVFWISPRLRPDAVDRPASVHQHRGGDEHSAE